MATDRMALLEQLGNAAAGGDVDFLRSAVKVMAVGSAAPPRACRPSVGC
jgi:hypothetical protein